MSYELLHRRILANVDRVGAWFKAREPGMRFPFYSSFDLRDAGFKLGPVDANIYPAGFNNICAVDRENAVDIAKAFLDARYSPACRKILLLTEEHTANPYYWDNVLALEAIVAGGGREVRLAVPRELEAPLRVPSASGRVAVVHAARRTGETIEIEGFTPDLILSNNDFSLGHEEWARDLGIPINPPRELGWYRRRKDRFFKAYNELVGEFCEMLRMDPWTMQVETEVFTGFEVDREESRDALSRAAEGVYARVKASYAARGIGREPFLFVKNNAGTYGLGVIPVKHPAEIRGWNYKARKKMKAAKGGREITEVIIQEGIPTTTLGEGGSTAEPVIYMIGGELAGGFLRTHGSKGDDDSLNSPGAVFQRLCVSDLEVKLEGRPMENSYGWTARLASMSVAIEARELGVEFPGYKPK